MQKLILNIEDKHYLLFLQFLKTLDYVQILPQSESGVAGEAGSPIHWLEQLAKTGGIRSIEDPVEWQRSIRTDRNLHR